MPKSRSRPRKRNRRQREPGRIQQTIWPLPPDLVSSRGEQLTHSPAYTWLNLKTENEVSDGARTLIKRWPFRIVRAGKQAPDAYACLALLAYKQNMTVDDCAQAMANLEDLNLIVWSGEHNVYVMGPETAEVRNREEGWQAATVLFDRIAQETPAEHAARRWTRPTVIAVPVDEDTEQPPDADRSG